MNSFRIILIPGQRSSALDDINNFYNKVDRETSNQSTEIMQTLQSALAFNAYVFSQKNDNQLGSNFRNLSEQMGHCGPGSITSVILQASELKGLISKNTELSNWLTQLRKTTFDRLIQQHREDKDVSVGMDVHLRPTFLALPQKSCFIREKVDSI
ncbi:hypothetical protein BN59_03812 [Legionella massiliensis]|uniref:Uncharacterized protein n=2 Tax=Legionella massiliensis TaxID=1034943 RepID=A0A078L606_9GAMM|nr:hypothetical protein BN59_03812 [Legionella massiliensis]CEE15232.1 hypothetical protein BN1094_03812 [Legionella massiliensis]